MRQRLWSGLVLAMWLGCAGRPSTPVQSEVPAAEAPAPANVPVTRPVLVTQTPAPKDPIGIQEAGVRGDVLEVQVRHPGGCKAHTYELQWNGSIQKSESGEAQAELVLRHDANGDNCEALFDFALSFDLTPFKQRWKELSGSEHGAVLLRLANSEATARYTF